MVILPLLQSLGNQFTGGYMKHNQTIITLALVAGALVGAVQTLACNPSAALTGRLVGEFIGATVFYMIVFWVVLHVIYRSCCAGGTK